MYRLTSKFISEDTFHLVCVFHIMSYVLKLQSASGPAPRYGDRGGRLEDYYRDLYKAKKAGTYAV